NAGDARRAELARPSQRFDPALHPPRRAMRTGPRPARAVLEPVPALPAEPSPPLVGRRSRNRELRGDMGNRSTVLDPLDQHPSTMLVQSGVTVHKSLLGTGGCCASSTLPRRLL